LCGCGLEDCAADNGNCGKRRKLRHGSFPVRPREAPQPDNVGFHRGKLKVEPI
jgi:hypothetical protein